MFDDDPAWWWRDPVLGSRCVRVEGRFVSSDGASFDRASAELTEVRRLEVWLTPYRPLVPEHQPPMQIPQLPERIREQLHRAEIAAGK